MSGSFKHPIMSSDLILLIQEARKSVGPIYFYEVMWKLCDARMSHISARAVTTSLSQISVRAVTTSFLERVSKSGT